jgi:hypothetical protein
MATPRKGKIPDDVKTKPVSENRDPITGEPGLRRPSAARRRRIGR